jgi:hypothetical protein
MQQPARYCENCGKPLNAQARFCGRCGQPVQLATPPPQQQQPSPARQPAPPPPQYNQAAPQEPVLDVLPGATRSTGLMGMKKEIYVIVVTGHRLIFARQTNQMMQANIRRAREAAKQQGKGSFGQWGAQLGANMGNHYLGWPPQNILGEHPDNWFIFNNQVRSARLKSKGDEDEPVSHHLELKTTSGKFQFTFQYLKMRESKNLLRQALGNVVR